MVNPSQAWAPFAADTLMLRHCYPKFKPMPQWQSLRGLSVVGMFSAKSCLLHSLQSLCLQPKISLKVILHKTVVFQEPHSLHLSLEQSNSSPVFTGFPNFIPGKWRLKYRFLPFHRAQWPWYRIILLISKTFTYQESPGKTSFEGQNTFC